MAIQTFGDLCQVAPHIHVLVADGLLEESKFLSPPIRRAALTILLGNMLTRYRRDCTCLCSESLDGDSVLFTLSGGIFPGKP